jgi:hypothetical protein
MFASLLLLAAAPCAVTGPAAARVCAEPELRALDEKLVAAEAQVARGQRAATWRARGARFRNWLATDTDSEGKPAGTPQLAQNYRDFLGALEAEAERGAGVATVPDIATALGDHCLARWLAHECTVPASGILRGKDGMRIVWQLQAGSSEAEGIGMGVMLWDATAPGSPVPIGWSFDGVYFSAPRLTEQGLLWVAGITGGSGGDNADLLFEKRDGRWVEIDTTGWRDTLEARLPDGFSALHAIEYDFDGMGGFSELWRDDDANCCATGGRVRLDFTIAGTALKLERVDPDIVEKWRRARE